VGGKDRKKEKGGEGGDHEVKPKRLCGKGRQEKKREGAEKEKNLNKGKEIKGKKAKYPPL